MGFVHHSNYARYFETARWEMFRELGISYKSIEEMGYLMPVVDMNISYKKPAFYDNVLFIKTRILKVPRACVDFVYEVFDADNQCINQAKIRMAFINKNSRKICKPPQILIDILEKNMLLSAIERQ